MVINTIFRNQQNQQNQQNVPNLMYNNINNNNFNNYNNNLNNKNFNNPTPPLFSPGLTLFNTIIFLRFHGHFGIKIFIVVKIIV